MTMLSSKNKNKGKYLEDWIQQANEHYKNKGLGMINKIPTPWQVIRKYNPYKKTQEIASAFPLHKSSVDFGGTASGKSIWFEAKVTKNKTSFPLSNIHKHQIEYLEAVDYLGGKAFFLIHSEQLEKTWLLWINQLLKFISSEDRKSIPFSWFEKNCPTIGQNKGIILDYLSEALR